MGTRIAHLLSLGCVGVIAAGCATAPSRFYTLASTAAAGSVPSARYAVVIEAVSIPATVDRPQFVVQVAPNRVDLDEFNRWAAPLDEGIARAIAGDLSILLGTPHVATAAVGGALPDYRITVAIQRFDSIPGDAVLIEAAWAVRKTGSAEPRSGRTVAREAVDGPGFDALAAAHSRALATISGDIAMAVRATADARR